MSKKFWAGGTSLGSAIVASLLLLSPTTGNAAIISIPATDSGTAEGGTGISTGSAVSGRVNGSTAGSATFTFLISPLALNEVVTGATFTVQRTGIQIAGGGAGTAGNNADLYALPVRATAPVLVADYFVGPPPNGSNPLLQDNFDASGSTGAAFKTTSLAGDAALLAYVIANYTTGNVGQYMVLRLSPDGTTLATNVVSRFSYQLDNTAPLANQPTITLTTAIVPEPASAMLLGFAGLILLGWKRRR